MKKFWASMLALACGLALAGCSSDEEVMHSGVNAVVVAVDSETERIVAEASADGAVWEIDCAGVELIYCDFATSETWDIALEDMAAGDDVALVIRGSELNKENGPIKPQQIQLVTQR